ncbi:hypothetical protein PV797_10550 [Clostridiaceae bacterium M8S5]|nr:hypothetical protein PV797_10550 [Clostridiaceae bacterium M8S5]
MEKNDKLVGVSNESNCENELSNEERSVDSGTVIGSIFQRVVTDEEFKALLLSHPEVALLEYELSDTQAVLIKSLSEEDLDKLSPENLEEFFAADAAVYTPDDADLVDFEAYEPDDFEEME